MTLLTCFGHSYSCIPYITFLVSLSYYMQQKNLMLRNLCSYTHIIFYTIYNIFRPTYKFHAICKKSPSKFDTISNSLSHTVHFWYHLTSFLLTLQVLQHTYNFFVIVQVSYHIYFCFVILQVSCPIHLFLLHPHILIPHALNYRRTIPNPFFL